MIPLVSRFLLLETFISVEPSKIDSAIAACYFFLRHNSYIFCVFVAVGVRNQIELGNFFFLNNLSKERIVISWN